MVGFFFGNSSDRRITVLEGSALLLDLPFLCAL